MDSLPEAGEITPDRTRRYGTEHEQVIDFFDADGERLVVLIHGGFWKPDYDRMHLRPMAAALRDNGFDVALIEYRRPDASPRWPTISADVRSAIEFLPTFARKVVVGHSAGGQLAVWALHQFDDRNLVGAVSLAGCLDLTFADDQNLGGGAVKALLGGPAAEHQDADPMALAPPPAPVFLIHGDDDADVPVGISRRYRDRAAALNPPHAPSLIEVSGADHWPFITPDSDLFPMVVDAMDATFNA